MKRYTDTSDSGTWLYVHSLTTCGTIVCTCTFTITHVVTNVSHPLPLHHQNKFCLATTTSIIHNIQMCTKLINFNVFSTQKRGTLTSHHLFLHIHVHIFIEGISEVCVVMELPFLLGHFSCIFVYLYID